MPNLLFQPFLSMTFPYQSYVVNMEFKNYILLNNSYIPRAFNEPESERSFAITTLANTI
jgi:hypothetical protein